jgi:hypothetical protein
LQRYIFSYTTLATDQSQNMQSDGFGVTNTAWAAQYVAMTGENTSAVSLFLLNDVTYTIEARLNEFGFPGNLINSITYVADRYGMQDVPLIVPNHVSAFWIVVKRSNEHT